MSTIFNRAEVFITMDPIRYVQAKDALRSAGTEYTTRSQYLAGNDMSRVQRRMREFLRDRRMEQRIFVHRKRTSDARRVIG